MICDSLSNTCGRAHVLQVQEHSGRQRGAAGGAEVRRLPARPVLLAGLPEGGMEAAQACVQG